MYNLDHDPQVKMEKGATVQVSEIPVNEKLSLKRFQENEPISQLLRFLSLSSFSFSIMKIKNIKINNIFLLNNLSYTVACQKNLVPYLFLENQFGTKL